MAEAVQADMKENIGRKILLISWVIKEVEHTVEPTDGREFVCKEMYESKTSRTFWAVLMHGGTELSRYRIADLSALVWEDEDEDEDALI